MQKQFEAIKKFHKKTSENVLNSISKLKINILLHAQVIGSPFDVCKVDRDALNGVE